MLGKLVIISCLAVAYGRPGLDERVSVTSEACPPVGHWLLPHEYDCTKFYYCEYGVKWESSRDCAPGTEFSDELQVCIHPALANCNLPGVPPTEPAVEPTTTTTTPEPTTTTTTPEPTTTTTTPEPTTTTTTPEPTTTTTPEPTTTTTTPEPTTTTTTPEPTTTTTTPEPTTTTTTPEPTTTTTTPEPTTTTTTPEPTTSTTTPEPTTTTTTTPEPTTTTTTPEPSTTTTTPEPTTTTTTPEPTTTTTTPEPTTTEPTTTTTTQAPTTAAPDTTTTQATPVDPDVLPNGCPADFHIHQLLPHAECDKFYYCNFGEKVERDCAPGTHFNPVEQVCDWPWNAGCESSDGGGNGDGGNGDGGSGDGGNGDGGNGDGGGSGDGGSGDGTTLPNGCPADFEVHQLLPHEDCGKFYYCVFGEKVERDCAAGTHFNPVEQVCDWPWNAGCESSDGGGNGDGGNGDGGSGDGGNGDGGNGDGGGSGDGGSGDGTTLPNGCPADFEVHQLLPHEDCGKFYYCVFGEKVERDCAAGTHFNPVEQVCDWPLNAGCESSGGNGDGGSGDGGNGDGGNGDGGNGDGGDGSGGETLPNGCPADFEVHQLLPHEDCGKFYYCVFGEKVERDCAAGTHFNPVEQVCDWPLNAGCESSGGNGDGGSGDGGNGDGGSGDGGNGDGGNGDGGNGDGGSGDGGNGDGGNGDGGNGDGGDGSGGETLPNGCPADFEVHQLLPHEDCGKFYYCVFGEKVERDCAAGTHFNPVEQVCDWPWNAGCESSGGNGDGDSGDGGNGDGGNGDGGSGDGGNGDGGDGDGGNGDGGNGDGGNGDGGNGDGGSGDGSNGTLANGCPADFEVHQLLPHEDCGKFYYCVFGEKVERECAAGLHFNPVKQVCDWPWDAGCESNDGGGDGGSGGDNSKCEQCNVLPWAHETDCDKYWICEGETAVLVTCSEGLHFNAKTSTCDFICNANCDRDEIQATAEARGINLFVPWDKANNEIKQFLVNHH